MCDPLTAVAATLSLAQGASGYIAQSQQASATKRYNQQLADASLTAYDSSVGQGQTQQVYQDIKAAHAIDEEQRQARAGEATAVNSAGEAGIGGITMMELSRDFYNKAGRAESDINEQRDASNSQIEQQIVGAGFQYQDRLNQRKVVSQPNVLTPLMSTAAGTFNAVNRIQPGWYKELLPASTVGAGNQGEGTSD